jgi:hypothetical protein
MPRRPRDSGLQFIERSDGVTKQAIDCILKTKERVISDRTINAKKTIKPIRRCNKDLIFEAGE